MAVIIYEGHSKSYLPEYESNDIPAR